MRLISRLLSGAHLLHTHHHLNHIQLIDDLLHLGRGDAGNNFQDIFSGGINVYYFSGDLQGGHSHGTFRPVCIDGIIGDKLIQKIKILLFFAVQLHNFSVFHTDRGLRIIGAVHCHKPHLRPFINISVLIYRTLIQYFKTL